MDDVIWSAISTLAVFYCGYKLGQHFTAVKITRMLIDRDPKFERMLDRAREEIARIDHKYSDASTTEELSVERHGDQIYIYTKSDGEFLAQGSDLEECLARIEQRFPGRNFRGLISKEQADTLGISVK